MNELTKAAIALLVASAGALVWGISYRGNHPYEGVANFFGSYDPTYALAGWAAGLGGLAFIVGIGLLVAGLNRQSNNAKQDGGEREV